MPLVQKLGPVIIANVATQMQASDNIIIKLVGTTMTQYTQQIVDFVITFLQTPDSQAAIAAVLSGK